MHAQQFPHGLLPSHLASLGGLGGLAGLPPGALAALGGAAGLGPGPQIPAPPGGLGSGLLALGSVAGALVGAGGGPGAAGLAGMVGGMGHGQFGPYSSTPAALNHSGMNNNLSKEEKEDRMRGSVSPGAQLHHQQQHHNNNRGIRDRSKSPSGDSGHHELKKIKREMRDSQQQQMQQMQQLNQHQQRERDRQASVSVSLFI